MAAFLGVAVGQRAPGEVDRVHPAAHGVHAAQRIGQRHSDEPRVDHPAGDVGQQRCVQHVVDGEIIVMSTGARRSVLASRRAQVNPVKPLPTITMEVTAPSVGAGRPGSLCAIGPRPAPGETR